MSSLPTRIGAAAGCGIVALVVLGTTLWFLGDALMLGLEAHDFPPAGAAGLTGLAGLVLTGAVALTAKVVLRAPKRIAAPPPVRTSGANGIGAGIAADLGALAAQQIVAATRARPYTTMGAALAVGIAVGAVPELRKALTGLLKR